jgi:hypothetical protein
MTCYGDSLTFLYRDDVRTAMETHICHHGLLRGSFYIDDVRTSLETRISALWPVTGIALRFYI